MKRYFILYKSGRTQDIEADRVSTGEIQTRFYQGPNLVLLVQMDVVASITAT